ncbi:VTT domain-containing protein [Pseudokineococcus basanitobsidens]|uniref:VTT domain-containing protein n=1 Tax=Pseudokineococcus basanitobsidens TaxID=1926649 RepID=A0ABU8RJH7_9ACTN
MSLLDPDHLLASLGPLGILLVLFAETGLLVGVVLPGDTLLLTAGLLAASPATSATHLDLAAVLAAAAVGALAGAQTGYQLGRVAGPRLLDGARRPRLRRGAERAAAVLERYGPGRAVVLARFVPVVRTVLNPLAGAMHVRPRVFVPAQVAGGLVWSLGLPLAGYLLGSRVPGLETYLLPVVGVVVVLTLVPLLVEAVRSRRAA